MSCGGRFGGAAGQVEPLSRKELCPARGGHTEGQFVLEDRMCAFHIRYTVGIKIGQALKGPFEASFASLIFIS